VTRSTRTWSPTSRVLAMEAEGMTKFWKAKVMAKIQMAARTKKEAMDSGRVSFCLGFGLGVRVFMGVPRVWE